MKTDPNAGGPADTPSADAPSSARSGALLRTAGFAPLLAVPIALLLLGLLELTHLPSGLFRAKIGNAGYAFVHTMRATLLHCVGPIVYGVILAVVESGPIRRRNPPLVRLAVHLIAAGLVSAIAYRILIGDEAFRHPAFIGMFVVFALLLTLVSAFAGIHEWKGFRRMLYLVFPIGTLMAAVGVQQANYVVERFAYPSFHYAALLVAATLFMSGMVQFTSRGWLFRPRRRWARIVGYVMIVGLLASIAAAAIPLGKKGNHAKRYVNARTAVGQARLIANPNAETKAERRTRLVDPEGVARFAEHSGLPKLPEGFRLEDYNVLFVAIETLRFDHTSMADPERDLTPNMAKFGAEGAFTYHHAYSPSSGTLQSIGSIFSMRFPAAVRTQLVQTWKGRLAPKQKTVAEVMTKAGWRTFASIHNHQKVFTQRIKGLPQGFTDVDYILETSSVKSSRSADTRIVDAGLVHTRAAIEAQDRFFGWLFLTSPHHPYVAHQGKGRQGTKHERYQEEIQNADKEVGRLIEELRSIGALDNTIVIIAGDHGEEFGEHGGKNHAAHLHEEVTRVPLMIWIPGVQGSDSYEPLSLTYLFPWLLIESETKGPRKFAKQAMQTYIGPVLRATKGAPISELVGKARHFSSMTELPFKIIYDQINEVYEAYDLEADPGETYDLALAGDPRIDPLLERFEKYLEVYNGYTQYEFLDKMPGEKKKKKKKKRKKNPKLEPRPKKGETKGAGKDKGTGKDKNGKAGKDGAKIKPVPGADPPMLMPALPSRAGKAIDGIRPTTDSTPDAAVPNTATSGN